jgi:hypothetical protein
MGSVRSSTKYFCWQITLHPAVEAESTSNRITVSCNCNPVCTGYCCCKKNQVQCSVYCHTDEYDCRNLWLLTNYIGKLNPGSRASWVSCQTEYKRTECKKENQCNSSRTKQGDGMCRGRKKNRLSGLLGAILVILCKEIAL